MTVSTGEKRSKSEGKEYESPPPIPSTPKELDVLLDKWIVDGVFKPNHVFREPTEEEWRNLRFCHLHNYVQHATAKCWAFLTLLALNHHVINTNFYRVLDLIFKHLSNHTLIYSSYIL